MSNAYQLGQILYETEATWAENVNTWGTLQLPIIGAVDTSGLKHDKIDSNRTVAYRQGGSQYLLGPQGGSVKTKMYLAGHGSTTAGATTLTAIETLLGIIFGNVAVSAAAGTTLTGGTATVPITTASGTFAAGSLCRIGTLNDTRGNGQVYPIATHVTTNLTLLAAMDNAPTNGDVLYSGVNIYPFEVPTSSTVQSIRMQLLTANMVYNLRGVYPMAVTISGTNFGEFLQIEVEWGVSAFTEAGGVTFPNIAVTLQRDQGAPNCGGSVFVNAVGTATRVKRTARNLSVSYKLGIVMEPGPGGTSPYQVCVGARRTPDQIMLSWNEDAPAQSATPSMVTDATGTQALHICGTFTTNIGSCVGIYAPNVMVSERPIQFNDGGINRLRFTGEATTGLTVTNDLTMSALRLFFA